MTLAVSANALDMQVVRGTCVRCTRPFRLSRLQFVSPTNGWATGFVSEYSVLLHTTDGGKHWREVPDIETDGVNVEPAFWFLDAKSGWVGWPDVVVGDHLIRTGDGGRTWRNLHARQYWVDLQFFNGRLGVGTASTPQAAQFCTTSNGGADWHEQTVDLVYPSELQFVDTMDGWIAGAVHEGNNLRPRVLYTADGGGSWRTSSMPAGILGSPRDMFFADGMHGWLILWNGRDLQTLLRTNDGARTWQEVTALRRPARQLDAVRFFSGREGLVFARDEESGATAFFRTEDGGDTWLPAQLPAAVQSCTSVGSEIWCAAGIDILKFARGK